MSKFRITLDCVKAKINEIVRYKGKLYRYDGKEWRLHESQKDTQTIVK